MTDNNSTSIDNIPESTPVYAILHFDLCQPEGERRLRECLDAPKVISAVDEYARWLRSQVKYEDNPPIIYKVWDRLFECFADNDVTVPGWE